MMCAACICLLPAKLSTCHQPDPHPYVCNRYYMLNTTHLRGFFLASASAAALAAASVLRAAASASVRCCCSSNMPLT